MEYSTLYDLITCLEYGTKLHISVVFFNDCGNFKTELPTERVIHSKPYCQFMKTTSKGLRRCVSCRNIALKKAVDGKKAFGGLCINGIYEYCHPVIDDGAVLAVIFIGNILSAGSTRRLEPCGAFWETFEGHFSEAQCRQFCSILENHIKLLVHEYQNMKTEFDPLIHNIQNYIEEGLYYDVSVGDLASAFHYNKKYIGKVFKKHTGMTINEYLNGKKLKKAEELLKGSGLPVTEISARSGFHNVTYFNRLFKKRHHMSPTQYRSLAQAGQGKPIP